MTTGVGAVIFGLVALLLLSLSGFAIWETVLLATGRRPITTYTRNAVLVYPRLAVAISLLFVFAIGLLSAHFLWDAGCG